MKKSLLTVLALPFVVAACTSEDEFVSGEVANKEYDVAQIEAAFTTGETTRMATGWGLEDGDRVGFAWMGYTGSADKYGDANNFGLTGNAYQNHPLTAEGGYLKPATSIYVGQYFSYLPYDDTVRNVAGISFSVENQPLIEGAEGNAKSAVNSIWISPLWTDVTLNGKLDGTDEAGIDKVFNIYPRRFSNRAGLLLAYKNNEPSTGAFEIYDMAVSYRKKSTSADVSVKSFVYKPTTSPVATETALETDKASDWRNKSLATGETNLVEGVTATAGAIKLTPEEEISTEGKTEGKFSYNTLPANAKLDADDNLHLVITTTYGIVTIDKPFNEVAKTITTEESEKNVTGFDGVTTPTADKGVVMENSFVNTLYRTGTFGLEVDFAKAVMDGMHVKDDAQLRKMLNYYKLYKKGNADSNVSEAKTGTDIKLYLDGDKNSGEFLLSKASIKLIEEINASAASESEKFVSIQPCTVTGEKATAIVVTNDGTDIEVPEFKRVFEKKTGLVVLNKQDWTWSSSEAKPFVRMSKLTNRGDIEVTSNKVEATNVATDFAIDNIASASITIDAVTEWKVNLTNNGVININADAELRAYNAEIVNNATGLDKVVFGDSANEGVCGKIENSGVLGVTAGTTGKINNYGYIKNYEGAKTYITKNQSEGASFTKAFAEDNKIGVIELTTATDNISVSNATAEGFIKYTWNKEEAADENGAYQTPSEDVKYNYLIVKENIEFLTRPREIKFIQIGGENEVVITTKKANGVDEGFTETKPAGRIGFILPVGCKANLKEGNTLYTKAAYVKGTFYVGGKFGYNSVLTTYFGGVDKDTDNIVKY